MKTVLYILLIVALLVGAAEYFFHGGRVRKETRERAAMLETAIGATRELVRVKEPPPKDELTRVFAAIAERRARLDQFETQALAGAAGPAPALEGVLAHGKAAGLTETQLSALNDSLTSSGASTDPAARRRAIEAFLLACDGSNAKIEELTLDAAPQTFAPGSPFSCVRVKAKLLAAPSALVRVVERASTAQLAAPGATPVGDLVLFEIRAVPRGEWESLAIHSDAPPVRLAVAIDFVIGRTPPPAEAP